MKTTDMLNEHFTKPAGNIYKFLETFDKMVYDFKDDPTQEGFANIMNLKEYTDKLSWTKEQRETILEKFNSFADYTLRLLRG